MSMLVTLVIGTLAVVLAARFNTVLNAILYTYSFMVSGLFIPTLGAFFWEKGTSTGALFSMVGGGSLTLLMMTGILSLPESLISLNLDATVYGIFFSFLLYSSLSLLFPDPETTKTSNQETFE
jgi:SSS family solute:Na+ symporter